MDHLDHLDHLDEMDGMDVMDGGVSLQAICAAWLFPPSIGG